MATDEQLIEQIQQGKSSAYGQLFRKYYQQIYSICFSILKNQHDAEDVTSETFFHAYLKLDQLKKPDKFFAWLKKIAQNRSKNYLRDKPKCMISLSLVSAQTVDDEIALIQPRVTSIQDGIVPLTQIAPDEHLLKQELINSILEAVEALPAKDREIVRARIDGLSHSQISEQLGISAQASMNRIHRARKKISAHLKDLLNAIFGLPKMFTSFTNDFVLWFASLTDDFVLWLPLKKILSGGILAMNIGTSTKVTIGIIGILVAGFIGFQSMTSKPTKNKEYLSTLHQKEMPEKSAEASAKKPRIVSASQPKQANKHIEPSEEELEEEFKVLPRNLEEEKVENVQSEVASETEVPETESSKTTISPELEAIFTVVKIWRDKARAIDREIVPLINQYAALGQIEQEIVNAISGTSGEENRRLHEELRQIQSEKEKLAALMDPLGIERDRITQELEQYLQANHGMTLEQFFDTYNEAYNAWRKAQ